MRIVTLNLNGLRSAVNKGFLRWLAKQGADVVCVQELKAQDKDLTEAIVIPGAFKAISIAPSVPATVGSGCTAGKSPIA